MLYWELVALQSNEEVLKECRRVMAMIRDRKKKPHECGVIGIDVWLDRCYSSGKLPEWF